VLQAGRVGVGALELTGRHVVFFGGKGGVGKTTCASAFALAASRGGRRVLLVSTDPAHSIADIFERSIGSDECAIAPNLWALELDAGREVARYVGGVRRDIERMFSAGVLRQAARQIEMAAASPGVSEVALLDRLVDLAAARENDYDLIVIDTAPTGHTVQLLRMPDAVDAWIHALVRHRRAMLEFDQGAGLDRASPPADGRDASDPVLAALERRRQRIRLLRSCMLDRARTGFALVTLPERLAIEETARAAAELGALGLDVALLIVNRVLPDDLDGAFYRSRKAQERQYLDEITRRFPEVPRLQVRQLPRDVYGLAPLGDIAAQLS